MYGILSLRHTCLHSHNTTQQKTTQRSTTQHNTATQYDISHKLPGVLLVSLNMPLQFHCHSSSVISVSSLSIHVWYSVSLFIINPHNFGESTTVGNKMGTFGLELMAINKAVTYTLALRKLPIANIDSL